MGPTSLIDPTNLLGLGALSAMAGVLSHLAYFIHGEHHMEAPMLMLLATVITASIFTTQQVIYHASVSQAALTTSVISAAYVGALWTSIIIYRVYFHRLGSFPGPPMAKVTKLWHFSRLIGMKRKDNFRLIKELHDEYGTFVRTGPAELTITSGEAGPIIHGPASKCFKADWYDMGLPLMSMHTARDKNVHDHRRRIWDRGFSAKALRDYEGRVNKYARDLVDKISSFSGKPLNASNWFNFFAFDVMGDLAFGKPFNMLQSGEEHFAIELLHKGQGPLAFLTPVPWMFRILTKIPGLSAGYYRFIYWCEQQVDERRKMNIEVPDIMSWLLNVSEKANDSSLDRMWMMGDSRLIIVAGSDTTAATLTYVSYFLAKYPSEVSKLRAELKPLLPNPANEIDVRALQNNAPHLNGVINEALRLHPPVPSGVIRRTPKEGIDIEGTHIPGDINVVTSPYSMGRLESCWERPEDFVPERWYSKPEMIKNGKAFMPFSLGPYGCIGKQLALTELRVVISLLVLKFDIAFAPGEDGSALLEKTTDAFTLVLSDLNLRFTKTKD